MKFLSSFDTKKDEKMLKKAIDEFGPDKAFLIKRHWLYLYKMVIYSILAITILSVLFIILSYLLNGISFWVIIFLNIIGIGAWIVITLYQLVKYLKNYKYIINNVSEEDLKDGLLEKYLKFSFFLFFYQIIVTVITVILSINNNTGKIDNILLNGLQISLSFLFLYLIWKTLYVLINFEMDFMIVTPKYINTYDQSGLFKRKSKTIGVEKIKSIQTKKEGIIRSFFNFGEIIILTEGDESGNGEILLRYIPNPDNVRQKIVDIMDLE